MKKHIKLIVILCAGIFLAVIAISMLLSIFFCEYFTPPPQSTLLSIVSFWVTFIAFLISIWTLCVAKSISKAKFDYVSQMQLINKRFELIKFIKQIEDLSDKNISLSSKYINRIVGFIEHIKCDSSRMSAELDQKKAIFFEIVQNPRVVKIGQLLAVLREIHDIMEKDNATIR